MNDRLHLTWSKWSVCFVNHCRVASTNPKISNSIIDDFTEAPVQSKLQHWQKPGTQPYISSRCHVASGGMYRKCEFGLSFLWNASDRLYSLLQRLSGLGWSPTVHLPLSLIYPPPLSLSLSHTEQYRMLAQATLNCFSLYGCMLRQRVPTALRPIMLCQPRLHRSNYQQILVCNWQNTVQCINKRCSPPLAQSAEIRYSSPVTLTSALEKLIDAYYLFV